MITPRTSLCLLIAAVGQAGVIFAWSWLLALKRENDNGSSSKDLFGPEPTFTEVEKQWEKQLPTQPQAASGSPLACLPSLWLSWPYKLIRYLINDYITDRIGPRTIRYSPRR